MTKFNQYARHMILRVMLYLWLEGIHLFICCDIYSHVYETFHYISYEFTCILIVESYDFFLIVCRQDPKVLRYNWDTITYFKLILRDQRGDLMNLLWVLIIYTGQWVCIWFFSRYIHTNHMHISHHLYWLDLHWYSIWKDD